MTGGTLNEVGIRNLQTLLKVLQSGQLEYDFKYQSLPFNVDWSVLLLSAGGRTLMHQDGTHIVDMTLKLHPKNAATLYAPMSQTSLPQPNDQQLNMWRFGYLQLARQAQFQIHPDMTKVSE